MVDKEMINTVEKAQDDKDKADDKKGYTLTALAA
jgi:hypothetical protein